MLLVNFTKLYVVTLIILFYYVLKQFSYNFHYARLLNL